jgi:hypothetical protein
MMQMNEETGTPRLVTSHESSVGTDSELALLRKEVIEARNLVIKTDNLLKNLHAELKQMGRKHDEQEKRHWMTSVTAYVAFAILAGAGAFAYARAEVRSAHDEAVQNEARAKQLTQESERFARNEAAHKDESEKAARVFELLGSEKEGPGLNQAMSQAMHLDRKLISPLEAKAIDDRAAGMKTRIADGALERGQRAFRQQDWRTASTELGRYVELQPKVDDPLVWFHLGNARTQTKEWAAAIQPLESFLKAVSSTKTSQYAGFLLGSAYEETGNPAKARDAYERAAGLYPGSEFATMIRSKLRRLSSANGAAAAPAAAPAAAATKPPQ